MVAEEDFANWLRESAGVAEPRRIARVDPDRILLSKFAEGFAARLHEALARVPELFEEGAQAEAYARAPGGTPRVGAWHQGMKELLGRLGTERSLAEDQRAEIMAGIDSVAALLDTILWSTPTVESTYTASTSEVDAYRDAVASMDAEPGIFTRFYGEYGGRQVVNHCPGAPFARVLLATGWRVCTGSAPPA
jgi:hypothetical protein